MDAGAPPSTDLCLVARACGALAAALGASILLGWLLGIPALTRISHDLPAAVPDTGLMFVGCGAALVLGARPDAPRVAVAAIAALVVLLATAILIEHATATSLGVDLRIGDGYGDVPDPGRPAVHTALAFLLLGSCLAIAGWRTASGAAVAGVLGAATAGVVGMAAAGYLVGVHYLYGTDEVHGVSVPSAVGFVVLVAGVFALRPETPPGSWVAGRGDADAAARRLMLPALVAPFLAGALVQGGASLGLYTERFALALLVVLTAAAFQAMIFLTVRIVRARERERFEQVQRFTTLAGRVPVGIFQVDRQGKPVYVNERWTEITGMSGSSFLSGDSVLHPADRDRVRADWAKAMAAGRDFRGEFRLMRPDGDMRWIAVHASALRDTAGEVSGFIGSVMDVTERRAAEERAGMVVDRIAEAVNIIGADGQIVHSNDAAREILEDLRQRYDEGPIAELGWGAVDSDGSPIPNDELPAEITRTTGRQVDERVIGFPGKGGDVRWLRISTRTLTPDGPPFGVVVSFVDVSDQREATAQLEQAESRFQLAFDSAPIGVNLVSIDGQILQVNQALCDMIGYSEEEMLATTFQELSSLNDLTPHARPLQELVEGQRSNYQMEMRYRHKDGSEVWALTSTAVVRDADGKPLHYIGQILDVTERRRLERQLRHHAEHDTLTGLSNRRVFAAALASQLARERRYGGESSLLMVDLDGFKEINDHMGHAAGDLVLQAVAYLLLGRVRDTDLVARLGGDEFAILAPETPRAGAEVLAIDIVQSVRELSVDIGDGRRAAVTASVGVACSDELPEERDEDSLLVAADLAMYEAKRGGRDSYSVHR